MARPKRKRPPSVAITASGGMWVAFVPTGRRKGSGAAERVKRSAAMCDQCKITPTVGCECWERCADKVRELDDQVAAKKAVQVGRVQTLGQYLDAWLAERKADLAYKTFVSYKGCATHLRRLPIGSIAITDVQTSDISAAMQSIAKGVSANEANKTLRTLRSALSDYERVHPDVRNMAKLVRPLSVVEKEVTPFSVEEVARIFAELSTRPARTRARWYLAIGAGLRQGEGLGLSQFRPDDPDMPPDYNPATGVLTIREKQYRETYEHGCDDPVECVRELHRTKPWLHKTKPCPDKCKRHTRACPPVCTDPCTAHAPACPQAVGGLKTGLTKTKKVRRQVLPPPVCAALNEWLEVQATERAQAGSKWVESGRLFTQPTGAPIDHRRDWGELQDILAAAGVERAGTHTTRHSTATFLKLLKVDTRIVQEILGWSTAKLMERYVHVDDTMSREAANAMAELLWPTVATQPGPEPGSATAAATVEGAKILPFRRRIA